MKLYLILIAMMLSSCAAVDTARQIYGTAQAGMTALSARKMVVDLKDAQPLFKDYDAVVVQANLRERNGGSSDALKRAFEGNMTYLVRENARIVDLPMQVCESAIRCNGRVLILQFTEEGFDKNLLEKVTLGSALKGTLTYYDASRMAPFANKRIEPVKSYSDVMKIMHASIWSSMYLTKDRVVPSTYKSELEALEPISPTYASMLDSN